jgi:hypothetical protein
MSRSNAAAINRRVNIPSASQPGNNSKPGYTPSNSQTSQTSQPSGFTLPQVISVIDSRLITLERFMRESKHNPSPLYNPDIIPDTTTKTENNIQYNIQEKHNFNTIETVSVTDFNTIINEFNSRFELFAREIAEMKDIVVKLQSYTMDVNKTLLEERIQVFSNLNGSSENISNNDLANTIIDNVTKNVEFENTENTSNTVDNISSVDLKNLN